MSSRNRYCLAALTEIGCQVPNCRKTHSICQCSCGLVILNRQYDVHVKGNRHKNTIKGLGATAQNAAPIVAPDSTHCEVCNKNIPSFRWRFHLTHPLHLRTQRLAATQTALDDAARDKNGVTVSGEGGGVDFGVTELGSSVGPSTAHSQIITIQKTDDDSRIRLVDFRLTSSSTSNTRPPNSSSSFTATITGRSKWIRTSRALSITITFRPSYEGRHEDTIEIDFHDVRHNQRFSITRQLRATVGSRSDQEALKPKAPYVRRKFVPLPLEGRIISPLRPPIWTETKWVTILPEFKAPSGLIKAITRRQDGHKVIAQKFMPSVFNGQTYGRHFQNLLWVEEEQRSQDLLEYSMNDAILTPRHPRYILEVAGLAEGRPSVLVGDFILVKHHGPSTDWYKGCVHEVLVDKVSLRFDSKFSTYRGTIFDVQFVLNRLPLRRMHQALMLKVDLTRLLFPKPEHVRAGRVSMDEVHAINPINRLIGEDLEQLMTVAAIVRLPPGSAPFVIFGPPGTGKTVTVVEAIRQLLDHDPNVSILACAPSNSAADLLATKLAVLGPSQLFRLNAASREYKTLPEHLREFSLVNGNLIFAIPSLERMKSFRVIVSTCVSGGVPLGIGIPPGHFSHIFIDEAGQCMEPEVMVPIKTMANNRTNVILAGDNKQLGPSIRSNIAKTLGLGTSYLARIMAGEVYDLETRTGSTIVKLVKNFRSHPAILNFSNNNFYNGELQPCGDPALTHSLLRSNMVKKQFPCIFHGIIGKDERESSSPSFFNVDEVTLVRKYCLELIEDRRLRLKPDHIGVITPYHAQRCKIGRILNGKLQGIKVGSVEEFQGQERRIIIMSTVRSSTDYLRYDVKHTLGFVANSRRLNVAITRAQALLIIIGNPVVLSLDPLWRSLLNYIFTNGGWRGKEIEWDPEEPVLPDGYDQQMRDHAEGEAKDMISRLKSFIVKNTEDLAFFDADGGTDSDGEGYMDNGVWREEE